MTATTSRMQQANEEASSLQFTSCEPVYGKNYGAGYVGFTYTGSNLISRGIDYATRWSCMALRPLRKAAANFSARGARSG